MCLLESYNARPLNLLVICFHFSDFHKYNDRRQILLNFHEFCGSLPPTYNQDPDLSNFYDNISDLRKSWSDIKIVDLPKNELWSTFNDNKMILQVFRLWYICFGHNSKYMFFIPHMLCNKMWIYFNATYRLGRKGGSLKHSFVKVMWDVTSYV